MTTLPEISAAWHRASASTADQAEEVVQAVEANASAVQAEEALQAVEAYAGAAQAEETLQAVEAVQTVQAVEAA